MNPRAAFTMGLVAFFGIPFTFGLSTLLGPFAWGLGREGIITALDELDRARAEDAVTLGRVSTAILTLLVLALIGWALVLVIAPPTLDGLA